MSEEKWAVYLDYGLTSDAGSTARIVHTVVLGGFGPDDREFMGRRLFAMKWGGSLDEAGDLSIWEVDEDDLPFGYTFQTYYVARYFDDSEVK